MEATYKILSAAGGHGNFASVTVTTEEGQKYHDGKSEASHYGYKEWLQAGLAGIEEAIKSLDSDQKVFLYRIEGTELDTNESLFSPQPPPRP